MVTLTKSVKDEIKERLKESPEEFEEETKTSKTLDAIESSLFTKDMISEVVCNLVGFDVDEMVKELITCDDYSEFKLADILDLDVNAVRSMLYRLLEFNLSSFTRKKDRRKGWYIYYWTFEYVDLIKHLKNLKQTKIDELKKKIELECDQDVFYVCPDGCEKQDFDIAMELNFTCQQCGEIMSQKDNSINKQNMVNEIDVLEKEIASFN